MQVQFNFRYSTEVTADQLVEKVHAILDKYELNYDLDWTYNGLPFLTDSGNLVEAARYAVEKVAGYQPQLLTTGGTSDGRFIAPTGSQVVELGPVNATIHKIDECVKMADIEQLTDMYEAMLEHLLTDKIKG